MSGPSRIDILLRLVPDNPDSVLQSLASQAPADPTLASTRDAYGYSLLHAAASYGHLDLMRTLVQTYHVDPNIADEDGDTPLFYAESLEVARCLVEELGADAGKHNAEGVSAVEKIAEEAEGNWVPQVLDYLRSKTGTSAGSVNGINGNATVSPLIGRPGMAPENVQIEFGTMQEPPEGGADPEMRRRIEELASKGDVDSEDVQRELRALVTDVVTGLREDQTRESQRRRVED
jgi:uncharacterized protein